MEKTYIKVYFAAPYTNPDPVINVSNYFKSVALCCKLWEIDDPAVITVPVLPHAYHFLEMYVKRTYDEWMRLDQELIKGCNAIVRLPGESAGAESEVAFARSLGIPVRDYHNNPAHPLGQSLKESVRIQQHLLDLYGEIETGRFGAD